MQNKGLTLIECLVSLLILTVLLSAGVAFYFYSHQSLRWATHKRMAIELANSELESIKRMGHPGLPEPAPPGGLWTDSNHTKAINVGNLTGQQNVYVYDRSEGGGADYKEVRVDIIWHQPGKPVGSNDTITMHTYIAP